MLAETRCPISTPRRALVCGREAMRDYQRVENATLGFDEMLVGVGADPSGSAMAAGLRVPPLPHLWYTLLLAVEDLSPGDRVTGWRLQASIAGYLELGDGGGPPLRRIFRLIETPGWCFADGFVTMVLTRDRTPQPSFLGVMPLDQLSCSFEDAGSAALVYETISIPAVPALPGYLGLDGYTPPGIIGTPVQTITDPARIPWTRADGLSLDVSPGEGPERWRLYALVFQTDPDTRPATALPTTEFSDALNPEDRFVQYLDGLGQGAITQYDKVAGSIFVQHRGEW